MVSNEVSSRTSEVSSWAVEAIETGAASSAPAGSTGHPLIDAASTAITTQRIEIRWIIRLSYLMKTYAALSCGPP